MVVTFEGDLMDMGLSLDLFENVACHGLRAQT